MKTRKREGKRFGGLKERVYLGRAKTLADLMKLDPRWKANAVFILRVYCRDMAICWWEARKHRTAAYMKTKKIINYCLKKERGKKRHRRK